jgi:hypothetical protein
MSQTSPPSGPRLIHSSFGYGVPVGVTVPVSVGNNVRVKAGNLVLVFWICGVGKKVGLSRSSVAVSEDRMLKLTRPSAAKLNAILRRKCAKWIPFHRMVSSPDSPILV